MQWHRAKMRASEVVEVGLGLLVLLGDVGLGCLCPGIGIVILTLGVVTGCARLEHVDVVVDKLELCRFPRLLGWHWRRRRNWLCGCRSGHWPWGGGNRWSRRSWRRRWCRCCGWLRPRWLRWTQRRADAVGLEVLLSTDLLYEAVHLLLTEAELLAHHVANSLHQIQNISSAGLEILGILAAHDNVDAVRGRRSGGALALDAQVHIGVLLEHMGEVRTGWPSDELLQVLPGNEDSLRQPVLAEASRCRG
mmetsp:Transcript_78581/g.175718  ORF Transcript_78581/g.175718 Transcript_78581/m.175718 type:complete len:249 (-) Transcript_78581:248-994(-)